jgi:hypothetical protein
MFLRLVPNETGTADDEAISHPRRRSPETKHGQGSHVRENALMKRIRSMSALIDLIYREYCRARLAELRLLVERHG